MISQSMLLLGRVAREPAVHATAAMASIPIASVGMHAAGFSTDLDTRIMAAGVLEPSFWLTIGIVAAFGAIGGLVAELLSLHGSIELPHRVKRPRLSKHSRLAEPQYELDLGIGSRLMLGAAAGLAFLAVFTPTSPTALAVNALIAGSAATGVFRLVQGRMLGKAQREAADASAQRSAGRHKASAPKGLSVVRDPAAAEA
jgi:hypothetical protein